MRELQALALPQMSTRPVCQHLCSINRAMLISSRPKTAKYPTGYPGDQEETFPLAKRELKNVRAHVKWNCEKCETLFKDTEKTCRNCGHEKCENCPSHPPRKPKRTLDEDAVKSVEERMKTLDISPQASAA